MKNRMALAFCLLCIFGILASCLKAPKRVEQSTDPAEILAPEPSPTEGETSSPPVADGLASLHGEQKSCVSCHEIIRPAPTHFGKEDCATCHSFPSFKNVKTFAHLPKPPACESCHARPATAGLRAYPNQGPPGGFDPNNKTTPGSGHYLGKECTSCHATPAEGAKAFVFSHSAPKAEFCLPCHFNEGRGEHDGDDDVTLRDFGNCYSCHQNFDRNATRNFNTIDD